MPKLIYNKFVPNVGPKDVKVVWVGEAPGADEETGRKPLYEPEPFLGAAGDLFMGVLGRNGVERREVRLANLSNYRPVGNKFPLLINTEQLTEGIASLHADLLEIKPNVIAAMGAWPLWFLTGKSGKKPGTGITHWRGSILPCILSGLEETKVIPTFHPSYVRRQASNYPIFDFDIKRILSDSKFPEFKLPERKYIINPSDEELEIYLQKLLASEFIAVDIETYGPRLACVGFSPSPDWGICIPSDTPRRLEVTRILLASLIPKTFHFGYFDTLYLLEKGYEVNGWTHDTYVAQNVMEPELPNTLAYLTSVYTREPYYKDEGKEELSDQKSWNEKTMDRPRLWIYNCKDVCTDIEIALQQMDELTDHHEWMEDFIFKMNQANGELKALSTTGMLIDVNRRTVFGVAATNEWVKHQIALNTIAGRPFAKKLAKVPGTELPMLLNARSTTQVPEFLYGDLKVRARKTREGKVTADEDALISVLTEAKKEYDLRVKPAVKERWMKVMIGVKIILSIRRVAKLKSSYLDAKTSNDGRHRSEFKHGPETSRLAAAKYIDGTGLNLMTIPRGKLEVD